MVKVNRINTSQIEGGYSDDSDKRPNGEIALYNDGNGGFDLVIHDGVNSTSLNKVLGKGKLYGHGADSSDGNNFDTIKLIPDITQHANSTDQYIIIDPTAPNHVHIRAGGTIDNSNASLYIGGENSYFCVNNGSNPSLNIVSNGNVSTFGTDGTLSIPNNLTINSGHIAFPDLTTQDTSVETYFNTSIINGSGISLSHDAELNTLTISSSGLAPSTHTHSSSDITDFNTAVSGLIPVKGISAGTNISISSVNGIYTINSTIGSGTTEANSLVTTVFNKTGSPIPKFTAVYINGGQGDQPTVALAMADIEATSSKTYGITAENIANMTTGKVIVSGALIGLNTDQFNPTAPTGNVNGVTLWLSPSIPGGITTTKPSAPNHIVALGTIVRTHQNQGVVEVKVQNGFELEELHNVSISGAATNQTILYNSSTKLWSNQAVQSTILNDYSTNTFTPFFSASEPTQPSITYAVQHGFYIKIGRIVNFSLRIVNQNKTASGVGNLRVSGLPFTASNTNSNGYATGSAFGLSFFTSAPTEWNIVGNTNYINLTNDGMPISVNNVGSTSELFLSGFYFVN